MALFRSRKLAWLSHNFFVGDFKLLVRRHYIRQCYYCNIMGWCRLLFQFIAISLYNPLLDFGRLLLICTPGHLHCCRCAIPGGHKEGISCKCQSSIKIRSVNKLRDFFITPKLFFLRTNINSKN